MVVVVGYVGDNPKVSMTQTGRKVAGITIATTEKGYTTQGGVTYPDKTEWHQIVLWGRLAEVVEKYVHKGSQVMCRGNCAHGLTKRTVLHATRPKSRRRCCRCLTAIQMGASRHR